MRTVLCIAAIAAVSFVPVSAQQTPPPTSSPRPATAPTTPPPTTVKPSTAPTPNLPATPSRKPPTAAAPSVNFEPLSGPAPQGAPRPGGTPQGAPGAAMASSQATSWQNVKLEIKISDSLNPGSPENVKTVSMLILDGRSGQVRSGSDSWLINIDARPTIRPDGRIYLQLGIEYRPELTPQQAQQNGNRVPTMYNEQLNLVVVDGKPILASQSADPRSDRKVVIEITATVVK